MPNVEDLFLHIEKIGILNDVEMKILRAMFRLKKEKRDKVSANDIAKAAGISVTNAYKYLYSLQNKWLIESGKINHRNQNIMFWLSQSSNPFPRIMGQKTMEYTEMKKSCELLEKLWSWYLPEESIWGGCKVYEKYEGNFEGRAAFIIDLAKKEILITADRFFEDFLILDAISRAIKRNVRIKVIVEQLHPDQTKRLRTIGIELRLGKCWPYIIVADALHGITFGEGNNIWFMNCHLKYPEKFEEYWKAAQVI